MTSVLNTAAITWLSAPPLRPPPKLVAYPPWPPVDPSSEAFNGLDAELRLWSDEAVVDEVVMVLVAGVDSKRTTHGSQFDMVAKLMNGDDDDDDFDDEDDWDDGHTGFGYFIMGHIDAITSHADQI